ncbi:MAG: hypothetical protein ACJAS1_003678 [Oleiphilaceae bacterium]|jgi:hypothetical protein
MNIELRTRQTAIVNHTAQYEVDDKYWQSLLDSGLSEKEAIEEARSQGEAESLAFETEMVESVQIHETDIS